MPLRLVIPLPGPFVYVSGRGGQQKRRDPKAPLGPGFWGVSILALAALGYGVIHVWWIAAATGVIVAAITATIWRASTTKGHRLAPFGALVAKVKADLAPLRRPQR